MTTPDLSIIIVSWNMRELLANCLRSVLAQTGLKLQVIVVDSASSDGSPELVAEQFPQVELLACQENVGFPRDNNLGLERANGRFILLLNPDTIVHGDALARMVSHLQQYPAVGVLGPQLLNDDARCSRRGGVFLRSGRRCSRAPGSSRWRQKRFWTITMRVMWLMGKRPLLSG